jgi:PEP-CTERM motif
MVKYLGAITLILTDLVSTNASAGLIGNVISATYDYPSAGTPYPYEDFTVNPFTVDGTVETVISAGANVNFNDDDVIITQTSEVFYGAASFNGPVFSIVSGNPFTSITSVSYPTGEPVSAFLSGGDLYINWEGTHLVAGDTVTVDFGSPVVTPEPSTWAMMALGFAGLGFMGWRGSRKTVPTLLR